MKIFGLIISVLAFLFVTSCEDSFTKCRKDLEKEGYSPGGAARSCKGGGG